MNYERNVMSKLASQGRDISRNYVFKEDTRRSSTILNSRPETSAASGTVCQKSSESLHLLANETSLALYRIEEHVSKTVPHLKTLESQISNVKVDIEGAGYDLDYTSEFLKEVDVIPELQNIQGWLKNALINAGQIKQLHERKHDL